MALPVQAEEPNSSYFVSYNSGDGITTLHARGIGFEPQRRSLSPVQKRLLAKRAALADGYRNLLRAARHFPKRDSRSPFKIEEVSGYLKGVEVENSRFYTEGKVEVELKLQLNGQVESFQQVREVFIGHPIPVCEIKTEKKYISREEYENLFRQKN